MADYTISDLSMELMQRGWPKVEIGSKSLPTPSWAYFSRDRERVGPDALISLFIPGDEQDHDLAITVASCSCCDVIASVQWFDPESSDLIAQVRYWPGLDTCLHMGQMFLDQLQEQTEPTSS